MKPKLTNQPYTRNDITVRFANGEPITADQHNFLLWHEKTLSSHGLDHVLGYYLKPHRAKQAEQHSFLLPNEKLDKKAIATLKNRLGILLQAEASHVEFTIKPEQFLQLRALTINELILYHGNQFLTGAPFYAAGIPHVLFFQWGNLFGVAKYVILAEEKALRSNILIYFEMKHERNIDQCVHDYQHLHKEQHQHAYNLTPAPVSTPTYQSPFSLHIPRLSLSKNNELPHD